MEGWGYTAGKMSTRNWTGKGRETGVLKKPSVVDGERSRTMFMVAKIAKAIGVSVDGLLS